MTIPTLRLLDNLSLLSLTVVQTKLYGGADWLLWLILTLLLFLQKPPTQVIDKEYKVLNHAFGYSKFAKHTASLKFKICQED